jgi:hypothetical protein
MSINHEWISRLGIDAHHRTGTAGAAEAPLEQASARSWSPARRPITALITSTATSCKRTFTPAAPKATGAARSEGTDLMHWSI